MMGLLGAFAGMAASIPLAYYFFKNPVPLTGDAAKTMIDMGIEPYMYFSMHPEVFYIQGITVFIITLIIALFPIYKSFSLQLIKALRA
jgi:ABC-type antimicrobial peptide transport system permease subunit